VQQTERNEKELRPGTGEWVEGRKGGCESAFKSRQQLPPLLPLLLLLSLPPLR